jgi:hypothetical protein
MADHDDVRRIARTLPGTVVADGELGFAVMNMGKARGCAWVWKERVDPKRARVPNPDVLAVRVVDEAEKQELVAADPAKFFTEPHYNGFPAVLVRLAAVDADELRELLTDAWRCLAPKALVRELDQR